MKSVHFFMTDPPYVALRHGVLHPPPSVIHGLRMGRSIHDV
jgi:hypothetical protein